ncbi:MAG: NADH-quinone oxidoreductase subunit L [Stellaceae bacterium]
MAVAIVFLPLLASVIAGFFGRQIGDRGAQLVTCGALVLAAALSIPLFLQILAAGHPQVIPLATWIAAGGVDVSWSIRLDTLSGVMIAFVSVVSAAIHVYSIGYMAEDPSIPRFMSYMSLFTFFMLALVTADNFVQLFFGWEGVGLMSYLLIGFWYDRPSANAAAIKAFVVNRIGDFGFALGIFAVFVIFGSLNFGTVFAKAAGMSGTSIDFLGWHLDALTLICILLFIGAMGKSAQLPLHVWLPDAMEGPTPVSALIHAATMVTAGVYMVARMSPLYEYAMPTALAVVGVIGATTCVMTATIGMAQNDIKKVVAYSTCSQLGYMFIGCAVSAYAAGIFHVFTHAFFKGLLFLCCGSVIHAMGGEQDMRRMGGLWRRTKITYVTMWVGALSLSGIPFFSGYYSKDAILDAAWASGTAVARYGWCLGTFTAFMTAFYIARVMFMTFHGEPRADEETMHHAHESAWVMLIPLIFLAIGAACFGKLGYSYFVGDNSVGFWKSSILALPQHYSRAELETVPSLLRYLPAFAGVLGLVIAYVFYIVDPRLPARLTSRFRALYLFVLNKWYFDELFDWVLVGPAFMLGDGLWKSGDGAVIDGLGPDGISAVTRDLARQASRFQSGYLYHYAFVMMLGLVGFVTWFFFPR